VLDADLTVTPAADGTSVLALAAVYRAPLGAAGAGLDRAILHKVASATVRTFLNRVAEEISTHVFPESAALAADCGNGPTLVAARRDVGLCTARSRGDGMDPAG
jgi:hypothetical protein